MKHVTKHGQKWSVRFCVQGRTRRFGSYQTQREAARHVEAAKRILQEEARHEARDRD